MARGGIVRRRFGKGGDNKAVFSIAENASRTLKKGMRIFVAGKLVQHTWQDEAGNKRQSVEIQVTHVGPDLQLATADVAKSSAGFEVGLGRSFGCVLVPGKAKRVVFSFRAWRWECVAVELRELGWSLEEQVIVAVTSVIALSVLDGCQARISNPAIDLIQ